MAVFRKKPVEVEAVLFVGGTDGAVFMDVGGLREAPTWLVQALANDPHEPGAVWFEPGWEPPVLMVHTLDGAMRAAPGDWIIRGEKGELYPCKPDIFTMTYDPAGDV